MYYRLMLKRILSIMPILPLVSLGFSCATAPAGVTVDGPVAEPAVEKRDEDRKVDRKADDEYSRSTHEVKISVEEFNKDKREILQIIDELSLVMDGRNYGKWLEYIEPDSVTYWSNPNNLLRASKRLPIKGMRLSNLNDYFSYVFVPSRKGRDVDEIRYMSLDSVKAVQVSDEVDVVYYNFVKINGRWMVKIPPLSGQE